MLLNDSRLLPSDLLYRVTQDINMVQSKRRDSHGFRLPDNVRTIVNAADSHLNNGHIHLLRQEHVEGHEGEKFEVRRHVIGLLFSVVQAAVQRPELFGKVSLTDRHAI